MCMLYIKIIESFQPCLGSSDGFLTRVCACCRNGGSTRRRWRQDRWCSIKHGKDQRWHDTTDTFRPSAVGAHQLGASSPRYSDLLDLVALLTEPETFYQRSLYGDKDAFRFAWLMTQQPFYYVRLAPHQAPL
jgi:hypothetical protein